MLTPNELVLFWGVITSVPILVKIDQEMRPWECSQTDRQTDTLTDWQTQTEFIICPMLYAIFMGQIKIIPIGTDLSEICKNVTESMIRWRDKSCVDCWHAFSRMSVYNYILLFCSRGSHESRQCRSMRHGDRMVVIADIASCHRPLLAFVSF